MFLTHFTIVPITFNLVFSYTQCRLIIWFGLQVLRPGNKLIQTGCHYYEEDQFFGQHLSCNERCPQCTGIESIYITAFCGGVKRNIQNKWCWNIAKNLPTWNYIRTQERKIHENSQQHYRKCSFIRLSFQMFTDHFHTLDFTLHLSLFVNRSNDFILRNSILNDKVLSSI